MVEVSQSAAIRILDWLHHAERDLVGTAVICMNGDGGLVKEVRLDDLHGVCFTFDDPLTGFDEIECGLTRNWRPVSTIKTRLR